MISSKRSKANTLLLGTHDENHVNSSTVSIDKCITNRHKRFSTDHDYSHDENSSSISLKYRKLSLLHDENDTRLFTGSHTGTCPRRQNERINFREEETFANLQQYSYSDEKSYESLSYSMVEENIANVLQKNNERCKNNSKFLLSFRNSKISAKYHDDHNNTEAETTKYRLDSPDGNINNSNSSSPRKRKSDSAKLIQSCQKILLSQQCQPKGNLKKTQRVPLPLPLQATENTFSITNIEANVKSKRNLDKTNIKRQSTDSKRCQHNIGRSGKSLEVHSSVLKNKCNDSKSMKCTKSKRYKHISSSNKEKDKNVDTDNDEVIDEWQSNFVKLLSLPIKIDHGYTAGTTSSSTDTNESNITIVSDSEDNVNSIVAEQHPASLVIKSYYDTNDNGDIQDWIVSQCHLYHQQNIKHESCCMSRQHHTSEIPLVDTALYRHSQEQPLYNDSLKCYEKSDTRNKLTTSDSSSSSTLLESNSMQTLMAVRANNEQYEDLQSRFRFNLLRLIGLDLNTLPPHTPLSSLTTTTTSTTTTTTTTTNKCNGQITT